MRYYVCFDCFEILPSTNNSQCINCDSRNMLYFDDSRITSIRDFYKLRVMMRVLKSRERVLYVLDYAIRLLILADIQLFPAMDIRIIEEKRDYIASHFGDI